MIANSRGPESLTSAVAALGDGVSAGTVKDAAAADIVVVAVMWPQVPQAANAGSRSGEVTTRIVTDLSRKRPGIR